MKLFIKLSFILLFSAMAALHPLSSVAQEYELSETAYRFISDQEIDSVLEVMLKEKAGNKTVSEKAFRAVFDGNSDYRIRVMRPVLKTGFIVLDQSYRNKNMARGSAGYQKARQQYLDKTRELAKNIIGYTGAFDVFHRGDYNDRILYFHSDLTVQPDGKINVVETIRVYNGNGQGPTGNYPNNGTLNDDIQRGIVRDFPTSYLDANGFRVTTGFRLKKVLKDGAEEPWVTESLNNGTRVKIGRHDVILPNGEFTYQIEYETSRQIIYHTGKDELYWNVNGNGWVFTADSVSCRIHFPPGSSIMEMACYTGAYGSASRDCIAETENEQTVFFTGTKRFNAWEGLTVAAAIQKGVLASPGKTQKVIDFLGANFILPVLGLMLALLIGFYYRVWHRKGRDPESGTIFPQFSPPEGLSPADVGYIINQKYGSHLFAATLVDFAVKRRLKIDVKEEGRLFKTVSYTFEPGDYDAPRQDTIALYGFNADNLYGEKAEPGKYNSRLKSYFDTLKTTLQNRFQIRKGKTNSWVGAFRLNRGYLALGPVLIIAGIILSFVFASGQISRELIYIIAVFLLLMLIVQVFFARIMSAYTEKGRKLADHILGFRMYLSEAEQHVYEHLTPPEKTLQLFEKYLPYAIALKVENSWAEKFDSIIQRAIAEGYRPSYYSGSAVNFSRGFSVAAMSKAMSSGLSNTISSASTPPSKSGGGSGGGGFSGGGGGGGGGGGW